MIFQYIFLIVGIAFFGCGITTLADIRKYYKRMNMTYDRVYADVEETQKGDKN